MNKAKAQGIFGSLGVKDLYTMVEFCHACWKQWKDERSDEVARIKAISPIAWQIFTDDLSSINWFS